MKIWDQTKEQFEKQNPFKLKRLTLEFDMAGRSEEPDWLFQGTSEADIFLSRVKLLMDETIKDAILLNKVICVRNRDNKERVIVCHSKNDIELLKTDSIYSKANLNWWILEPAGS